jgi:hypothetical protein
MLDWTVPTLPDQPRVGQHGTPISGVAPPPGTRRVDQLALAQSCGLGLSVPGTRLIRSVPSPVPRCVFFSCSKRAGVGECTAGCGARVDPQHGRTRAVGRRCTHRMSARSRAVVGSRKFPAGVSGGCDVWVVRTPLPPSLSVLAACKPYRHQIRLLWTEGGTGAQISVHPGDHGVLACGVRGDAGAGLPRVRVRRGSGGSQHLPDLHRQPGYLYRPLPGSPPLVRFLPPSTMHVALNDGGH